MRVRRSALAALIAVATIVLAPSAAFADADPGDGSGRAEGTYIEYTGTATRVDYDSDGVAHTDNPPEDATFGIECDDDGCRVYGLPFVSRENVLTVTSGSASFAFPASGNPTCATGDDGSRRAETVTIEATATSALVTIEEPSEGWVDCEGTQTYLWGITITIEATYSSGDPCVLEGSACPPEPEPTEEPVAAGGTGSGPGSSSAPRDITTPTVLSTLPTAAQAATAPNAIWAAVATIVLVLLIALPTHFFNAAAERASEILAAWWRRVRARSARREAPSESEAAADPVFDPLSGAAPVAAPGEAPAAEPVARPGVRLSGWPLAAAGVLAASVIAAFADPAFAFDGAGLRVFLSILISFGVEVVLGWFAVVLLVRRTHPSASANFQFSPVTLVIVVLAVLLTRITQFEPAIVFGLVAGVAFGGILGTAEKARVALIGLGWSFGIGILAWIGYSVIAAATGAAPAGGMLFLSETLSAAAIAGISTLPIALLPVRGLAGHTVWSWNRVVWAAAYAIGLFAFMLVLLPMPFSWAEVGLGIWAWVGLYLLYALAAVGVWLAITRPWRNRDAQIIPES
jgi:hypothetical protein